jgi:phenylacetate-CoA oxygenase PaaI subunit
MSSATPSEPKFDEAADLEAREKADRATTSVIERVESAGSLDANVRGALYALLSSLADNKYVLGRRYAEWCTGAPMLESAVAAAAMAQDELGHARSFYPLLRGFPEATEADTMEESGWQNRPTNAMTCLDTRFAAWGDFVAANFLVDTALTTLLAAATSSPYEPLRQRALKIVQEEDAHWVHAEGWTRRMASDEKARPALIQSLKRMWADAMAWFGQENDPVLSQLVAAGILASGPDELREQLRARLQPVVEAAGLGEDLASGSLAWDRWDATRRRLGSE